MSLEAIREIQSVEETMDSSRSAARAEAQKKIETAKRDGAALLAKGRAEAEKCTAEAVRSAEECAAKRREEILRTAEEECSTLTANAMTHMAKAVEMIVGRVVER